VEVVDDQDVGAFVREVRADPEEPVESHEWIALRTHGIELLGSEHQHGLGEGRAAAEHACAALTIRWQRRFEQLPDHSERELRFALIPSSAERRETGATRCGDRGPGQGRLADPGGTFQDEEGAMAVPCRLERSVYRPELTLAS
jgi:hypothetical protein